MREASGTHYDLTTLWQFEAPLELVWHAIYNSEAWPQWWEGAESVVTLERGEPSGVGARQRYTWKSLLPYRLSFVSCVTRVEPMRLLEGRVTGDLEGIGRWHFGQSGSRTTVRYEWQVHTTRKWMNLLAPIAKPLFCWNHDILMRAGGKGLIRHLRACRGMQKAMPS